MENEAIDFENRRLHLLEIEAARPIAEGAFGSNAITALALRHEHGTANAILAQCADWFTLTPPSRMTLTG